MSGIAQPEETRQAKAMRIVEENRLALEDAAAEAPGPAAPAEGGSPAPAGPEGETAR